MADVGKTCANCGHAQATGDFCEACGTRLPAAAPLAPPPQAPAPSQYGAPQYGATPAQSGAAGLASTVPQYAAPPMGEYQPPQAPYPPAQYTPAPRVPRDDVWGGIADFNFRRFPTPGLVRLAWVAALVWVALSLIVSLWVISDSWGGGLSVFMLLKALAVAVFTVALVRVALEAALALNRIREKKEQG